MTGPVAVYDGRRLVGFIGPVGAGLWEAQDDVGRLLGTHPSRQAAQAAVLAALAGR